MKYDLYSLQLFLAVALHKNIARAAEAQNIAASAVSKRISDLERSIGATLLYRRQRGVDLTPAGNELLRYAQSIERLLEQMEANMSEFADGLRGHIRIAANTSSITQFLPEDLAEFVERHPELRLELTELTSDAIIGVVTEGFADVGIFSGVVDAKDLDCVTYRQDTLVVIAPRGHPIGTLEHARLTDIVGYSLVGLQTGSSLQAFLTQEAAKHGARLRTRVEVVSFDGVRRMVEAGLGIAILPFGAAEPYLESSNLVLVPIDETWATRSLKLGVRDKAALTRPVRLLIDHLLAANPR